MAGIDLKLKRDHDQVSGTVGEDAGEDRQRKCPRTVSTNDAASHTMTHGKGKIVPKYIVDQLSSDDIHLIESIKTSCDDLDTIQAAIKLRKKHRLSIKLPEDMDDSTYYIEDGLRKLYPYSYLYQSYAKRRWLGRKLKDVLKMEFRDITDEQLKARFDDNRILVNGDFAKFDHVIKDNDFIANRVHRHELPVLATPIKVIYEDKETLVIDKPPSIPIHPCGRYRHNSITNILTKEYKYHNIKVVHRLDRLVSGVLMIARNTKRAHHLEEMIKNRDVAKEYVCRVDGKFPLGDESDDGYVTVNQPLEVIPGKIGIVVVDSNGKASTTKFKLLNYNGSTSAVLCKPLTGRMHQIRVHLQFLGHPIINDGLYNSDAFGPVRGKGGKYGKSLKQLSADVIAMHRAGEWLLSDSNDSIDMPESKLDDISDEPGQDDSTELVNSNAKEFLSQAEREETMAALGHFFTKESWEDMERKLKYDSAKLKIDPTCRDCQCKFYNPPLRRLFLYLHARRYSGTGWCYESEMPVWALDNWKY